MADFKVFDYGDILKATRQSPADRKAMAEARQQEMIGRIMADAYWTNPDTGRPMPGAGEKAATNLMRGGLVSEADKVSQTIKRFDDMAQGRKKAKLDHAKTLTEMATALTTSISPDIYPAMKDDLQEVFGGVLPDTLDGLKESADQASKRIDQELARGNLEVSQTNAAIAEAKLQGAAYYLSASRRAEANGDTEMAQTYRDMATKLTEGAKATDAERKKSDVKAALIKRGWSEDAAEERAGLIAAGLVDVKVDQANGRLIAIDIDNAGNPVATELKLQSQAATTIGEGGTPEPDSLPFPFGGVANLKGNVQSRVGGVTGVDEKLSTSRQDARLLRETLIEALSRSGRPSNYAQQRVEELFPSMSNPLASSEDAMAQLGSLKSELNAGILELEQVADDPSRDNKARNAARSQIDASNKALRLIDQIMSRYPGSRGSVEEQMRGSIAAPTTQEEFNKLPKGSVYRDPDDGLLYRKE